MVQTWRGWQLGLASALVMGGAVTTSEEWGFAQQINPDATLGAESSVLKRNVLIKGLPSDRIRGGAKRGANLFHSFQEFNIEEGRGAYFINPTGVENILSRVTGKNRSDLQGTLGVLGNANLFLLNPNGIIFGPNARLDINGSFLASTADSLNFADGNQFSANLQTTPLLTVRVPTGLQFGKNPGAIRVQGDGQGRRITSNPIDTSAGLRVQPNQTLALVGGDMALEGATLKTAGGRIELGSVGDFSFVSLTPINKGWALGYDGIQTFQDIQLSQQSTVDASGVGGGDVLLWGSQVALTDGSQLEASTLGSEPGGVLTVTASESVEVIGPPVIGQPDSGLFALVYPDATGAGGNLTLETPQLVVQDGAQVSTGTLSGSAGPGGDLTITASDSVEVTGEAIDGQEFSRLTTQTEGGGDAGNMTINTKRLLVQDGAQVFSGTKGFTSSGNGGDLIVNAADSVIVNGEAPSGGEYSRLTTRTEGEGNAGSMAINTKRFVVQAGGQVSAGAFTGSTGSGGNLNVNADVVEISGASKEGNVLSRLTARTEGGGDAKNLTINTKTLLVQNGGQVSGGTSGSTSTGNGGNLIINATDSVEVTGGLANSTDERNLSRLTTRTEGGGAAGNMEIDTGTLLIQDGAQVSAGTFTGSAGSGGNLTVSNADLVEISGESITSGEPSRLTNRTEGAGAAGNMVINAKQLSIQDGAQVTAGTLEGSAGQGGNLTVTASDSVEVSGASENGRVLSRLTTRTETTKAAGDLAINTKKLIIRDGGQVTASTLADTKGSGGDLIVNAADSVEVTGGFGNSGVGRSRLTTRTAGAGPAGNMEIDTGTLLIQGGAQVSAGTFTGSTGQGGNLTISASDSVEVSGASESGEILSRLTNRTEGVGDAKNLTISTNRLLVRDGGQVSADTLSQGLGGTLDVTASNVEVSGNAANGFPSSISAKTTSAKAAGDLIIDTEQFIVRDGAEVTVSGEGTGNAGELRVKADNLLLDNQGKLQAVTTSGEGGDITLGDLSLLLLRRNSAISTEAGGTGNGGNIEIGTNVLVAVPSEDSDIVADANRGNGGKVDIITQGIFGIEPRQQPTSKSDITASSDLGIDGVVEINTPDVDPSQGVIALPEEVIDASGLVVQRCLASGGTVASRTSKFVVTGRGGLPPDPSEPPSSDRVLADWITLDPKMADHSGSASAINPAAETTPITEAQGWVRDSKGQVVLTAQVSTATPHGRLTQASCPVGETGTYPTESN